MTWAFLDDHANENEKLQEVGSAAAWYWACGLMFCRRKEPDRKKRGQRLDFIPSKAALALFPDPKAKKHVVELVRVGLWLEADGGYLVNDYREVYGNDGAPADTQPAGPASNQPTPSQLGGKARAAGASRGPAGTFQPSQPRARQDPDPDPENTNKAAAKDLNGSARELAPEAAAALDLGLGVREFTQALAAAWHPFMLGGEADPIVKLVRDAEGNGYTPVQLARAGAHLGRWLSERAPDGRVRSLAMVGLQAFRHALDEVHADENEATVARERHQELLRHSVPRKATPPPLSAAETLASAKAALEALG